MNNRILIIDDNVNLTTLLTKTLSRFDYEVIAENDSSFAIDTTHKVAPNLILLDVMMPHKDGGEVLKDLRNDPALRHIPVILLTALAREAKGLANQGGIPSEVLAKPIELKVLVEVIERHLEAVRSNFTDELAQNAGRTAPEQRGGNAFGGPAPKENFGMPARELAPVNPKKLQNRFRALLGQNKKDLTLPR